MLALPCDCCGGCTATEGVCAMVLRFVSPFTPAPCPIEKDCPAKLVMKDGTGAVVYSGDMPWDGSIGAFRSACIHVTDHFIDAVTGADNGPFYDYLQLYPINSTLGYTALRRDSSTLPDCSFVFTAGDDDGNYHVRTGLTQYSCDSTGLHGHWVTGTWPGVGHAYPFLAELRQYLGVTDVYIDCNRFAAGCFQKFSVTGCNGLPAQGVTVDTWTDSGKGTHIGTGTTNAMGMAIVDTGNRTSFYYEATGSRFVTVSGSPTVAIGDVVGMSLSPGTGYQCVSGCAWPEPETLHATHPKFGALTFNFSAAIWVATTSYAYPGLGTCAADTVAVTCKWDGGTGYTEAWHVNISDCPNAAGPFTDTETWTAGAQTCYVPGSAAFSQTFAITPSPGEQQNMYGVGAISLTFTE